MSVNKSKLITNSTRFEILSALAQEPVLSFQQIKQKLNLTDGALSANMKKLFLDDFIVVGKHFVNGKPQTSYMLTEEGYTAFCDFLEHLKLLLKKHENQ